MSRSVRVIPDEDMPHYLQQREIRVGDQVLFEGHQYWVCERITYDDGDCSFLIRQPHWRKGHYLKVNSKTLMPEVPFTA